MVDNLGTASVPAAALAVQLLVENCTIKRFWPLRKGTEGPEGREGGSKGHGNGDRVQRVPVFRHGVHPQRADDVKVIGELSMDPDLAEYLSSQPFEVSGQCPAPARCTHDQSGTTL